MWQVLQSSKIFYDNLYAERKAYKRNKPLSKEMLIEQYHDTHDAEYVSQETAIAVLKTSVEKMNYYRRTKNVIYERRGDYFYYLKSSVAKLLVAPKDKRKVPRT